MSSEKRHYLVRYNDGSKRPAGRQPEVRIITEGDKFTQVFYQAAVKDRWHSQSKPVRTIAVTRYVPTRYLLARETKKR